jgi:formate hydrogenlyase transcriptional activator
VLVADWGHDLVGGYEQAFDALPGCAAIVDRLGVIVAVNRELERQVGYLRDELIGRDIEILVPGGRGSRLIAYATPSASAGVREAMVRRKDGSELPAEIALSPFETASGAFLIVSLVDMTERRRIDAAARAAMEQRLAIELVIGELSSQFITLPDDQIEESIRVGLQRICTLLDLDRGTLVRIGAEGALFNPLSWTAPGVIPVDREWTTADRFPWTLEQLLSGNIVCFSTRDEVPDEVDRRHYEALGTQSSMSVPLSLEGRISAFVAFSAVRTPHLWAPELVRRLTAMANVFGQVVARQHRDEMLRAAVEEANRLKNQLQAENVYLRHEVRDRMGSVRIVGSSAALRRVLAQTEQVATTDSTVLLLGETGTGKELLATHIHSLSARHGRPMVRVNCAAIPSTLVESELFGREKGAFTGALARQVGRFEMADHSTIFLDEIGDLPLEVQVKLLRVLEERKFERLGSPRPISVDTRIIAATHRNLEQRIADGAFREDLYYRLNVFPIHVPPLRERIDDIPALVYRLVEEFSKSFGKRIDVVERESLAALQQYSWPGNIRELRNVVERAMIVTTSRRLTISPPESSSPAPQPSSPKLADVERDHILAVLKASAWRIRGTGGAANRLGMKPTTLETRMAKLGLKRPHSS